MRGWFKRATGLAVAVVMLAAATAFAAVPRTVSYSGFLQLDSVWYHGLADLEFKLYSNPTGGTAVWTELQPGININHGLFSVVLGSVAPLPDSLAFTRQYYLGVRFVGHGAEMTPRTALTSVPSAMNPGPVMADQVYNLGGSAQVPTGWSTIGGAFVQISYPSAGRVVVQAKVQVSVTHTVIHRDCATFAIDVTDDGAGRFEADQANLYIPPSSAPTNDYAYTLPLLSVFPVTAGGTQSYYLNGVRCTDSGSEIYVRAVSVTART
jgi:archaellum component FlaF (FlaF/FlaG flagellin family)